MTWYREVHRGVVFAYCIASGWYIHIRGFPEAIKAIPNPKDPKKPLYVPDIDHRTVLAYIASKS